jgi:hypothetical protein
MKLNESDQVLSNTCRRVEERLLLVLQGVKLPVQVRNEAHRPELGQSFQTKLVQLV